MTKAVYTSYTKTFSWRYVIYAGTSNSERIGMRLYLMIKEYEMELFREVQAYVFVE